VKFQRNGFAVSLYRSWNPRIRYLGLAHPVENIGQGEPAQGQFQFGRLLTGNGLDLGDLQRRELGRAT